MPVGAFQDTLSQATWAMMQEWMNKKSRESSRQQMLEQAKIASAYQAEGGDLDTRRILDQLQASKEGAAFAKLLGITDQDDATGVRTMNFIKSLMPEAVPADTMALQPGMQAGAAKMSTGMGDILSGNFKDLDMAQLAASMGGMDNLLRMLSMGTTMQMNREELPFKAASARANMLRAYSQGGSGNTIADRQQASRVDNYIRTTRADVQRVAGKFTSIGTGSNFDAMLTAVMDLMPQTNMPPEQKKAHADQWVKEVGPEFFGELNGRVSTIWSRFNRKGSSPLTDSEYQLLADAGDIYGIADKFRLTKDYVMQEKQKETEAEWVKLGQPAATAPKFVDLMAASPKLKEEVHQKTWEELYGILPGVNER